MFPVAGAQRLGGRIPGSEVRRLPDAGHLLHMENADAVAPLYVDFLKTAANAPSSPGLANPASRNCGAKGGTLTIEKNANGDEFGVCLFSDNMQCEEWAMLRGDCRTGGIKVPGFVTPAAPLLRDQGLAITSGNNTPKEQGTRGSREANPAMSRTSAGSARGGSRTVHREPAVALRQAARGAGTIATGFATRSSSTASSMSRPWNSA